MNVNKSHFDTEKEEVVLVEPAKLIGITFQDDRKDILEAIDAKLAKESEHFGRLRDDAISTRTTLVDRPVYTDTIEAAVINVVERFNEIVRARRAYAPRSPKSSRKPFNGLEEHVKDKDDNPSPTAPITPPKPTAPSKEPEPPKGGTKVDTDDLANRLVDELVNRMESVLATDDAGNTVKAASEQSLKKVSDRVAALERVNGGNSLRWGVGAAFGVLSAAAFYAIFGFAFGWTAMILPTLGIGLVTALVGAWLAPAKNNQPRG